MIGLLIILGLVLIVTGAVLMGGFPVEEWNQRTVWGAILASSGLALLAALMLFS